MLLLLMLHGVLGGRQGDAPGGPPEDAASLAAEDEGAHFVGVRVGVLQDPL